MKMFCNGGLLVVLLSMFFIGAQTAVQLFPAIIIFGDSAVDVGNNNYLLTIFKANFAPYGRDFPGKKATGRFCNGRLATDYLGLTLASQLIRNSEQLGFETYAPAYLSPEASGNNLLIGANFASAGSGYDDRTALASGALSLPVQVAYFKEYRTKLARVAGNANATATIHGALFVSSFGNSDLIQNYYLNPILNNAYTPAQFSDHLVRIFSKYIKDLYSLGARKIGVTSLPPLGCLPAVRTLFGAHRIGCVARINKDARVFNRKLNQTATDLKRQLPDLKLVIINIYTRFYNITQSPAIQGFTEANRGCCGTGTIETTILLCNPLSLGTCRNATKYVFFDSVHPSQEANRLLAKELIAQGSVLLS